MNHCIFTICLIWLLGIASQGCAAQGQTAAPGGATSGPTGESPAPTGESPAGSQAAPTFSTPEQASAQIVATNEIVGIWELSTHADWKPAYWLVREDGSFSFSPQPDGSGPSQSGKYWFENNLLMIRDDFCPTPGSYRIRKFYTSPVTIRLELIEDACEARIKFLTGAPLVYQLPVK